MTAGTKLLWAPLVQMVAVGIVVLIVYGSMGIAQPPVPVCVTDEDRVVIRRATLDAIDEGLKDHMKALFAGWIKDPSNQPNRASAGLQAAIVAYQRARADALKWDPKSC
jgi:hypothetical protein